MHLFDGSAPLAKVPQRLFNEGSAFALLCSKPRPCIRKMTSSRECAHSLLVHDSLFESFSFKGEMILFLRRTRSRLARRTVPCFNITVCETVYACSKVTFTFRVMSQQANSRFE